MNISGALNYVYKLGMIEYPSLPENREALVVELDGKYMIHYDAGFVESVTKARKIRRCN